ncbi:hypothetical protein SAMN04515695_3020 [Pseudovibrio sp. Tun.PSC04-5.I4]|nr:hypothetical protein SAMN04515695_3020 [Pseudovibrio sp. Tun.PSC04-5.I4]
MPLVTETKFSLLKIIRYKVVSYRDFTVELSYSDNIEEAYDSVSNANP